MNKNLFFLIIIFPFSLANGITIPELQKKMEESSARIISMSCQYSREVRSSLTDETNVAKGIVYFKKPGDFRVEQEEPDNQIIVASGKYVYIYTPKFNQVVRDSRDQWLKNNFFFNVLSRARDSIAQLRESYAWKMDGNHTAHSKGLVQLTLEKKTVLPNDQETFILWVSEQDFLPRKCEIKRGTVTIITEILSIEKNPDLSSELFRFKKPPGSKEIHWR